MTTIPPVVPPLPVKSRFALDLPANAGFDWLAAGWRDLKTEPGPSLAYGLFVLVLSAAVVVGLSWSGLGSILFPALAGFLVFAPALATGLYEKSRALENGEPVSLRRMLFPRPASGGQILFTGALLCGLMLLWMRAAIIIYALFFGVNPFPAGLDPVLDMLLTTRQGAGMLVIERRDQQVRGHDAGNTRGNRRLERHELDCLQPVGRMLDERHFVMGVDTGIAVAGKMLAAGGDALPLQGPDDDRAEPGDVLRSPGQGPIANHGILRIGENVEHRSEVEGDAHGAKLGGQGSRKPLRQFLVTTPPERVHGRPQRERRPEPRHAAPLLIDADPERELPRQRLRLARDLGDLLRGLDVAREEDDAAEIELLRQCAEIGWDTVAGKPRDRELARLPDGVADRHRHIILTIELTASAATCMDNLAIARVFAEIGDLLEIKNENPFKIRAYRNAAETIAHHPDRVATLAPGERLELPGIGKDLAAKIGELVDTGGIAYHQELLQEFPPTILDLLHLQGVGPKTVALLYHHLGIRTLEELEAAARDGRLRQLKGMGARKEGQILKALEERTRVAGRRLSAEAYDTAAALVGWLREAAPGAAVAMVGSLRRGCETCGDLDILAAGAPATLMDAFTGYRMVERVLAHGETKSSVQIGRAHV